MYALDNRLVVSNSSPVPEFVSQKGSKQDVFVLIQDIPSLRPSIVADINGNRKIYEIEDEILATAIFGEVRRGFLLKPVQGLENYYARAHLVVIKIITIPDPSSKTKKENPTAEMSFLQLQGLESRNVSRQIDCVLADNKIFSVMPHYGVELLGFAGKFPSEKIKHCFRQITLGVRSLQMQNICHRDLSLENILINEDTEECCIIDFGMALLVPNARKSEIASVLLTLQSTPGNNTPQSQRVCSGEDASTDGEDDESFDDDYESLLMLPQGTCGKQNFIAPEILDNREPFDGLVVDNWALGVILFMLFTGRTPFRQASNTDKWFRQIQRERLQLVLQRWKIHNIPDDAVDLLDKLLRLGVSPKTRYSTSDILAHPWMMKEREVV